jgi:hypothetical protein
MPLRRIVSILLLLAFALLNASPLFALTAASRTPIRACCLRSGAHHCLSTARSAPDASAPRIGAPQQPCPFCPLAPASAAHPSLFAALAVSASAFAPALAHPAGLAQTESRQRIARDRSRSKRGPPAPSI